MILLVYTLVQHFTIVYYGTGIIFGVAMFCFSIHVYYVRKLYVAPPSVFSDVSHNEQNLWV